MDWISALEKKKNNGCVKNEPYKTPKSMEASSFLWGECVENEPYETDKIPKTKTSAWLIDSEILGRLTIAYDETEPGPVLVDGTKYTKAEIEKLKGLDRESILAAHNIKAIFQGAVQ